MDSLSETILTQLNARFRRDFIHVALLSTNDIFEHIWEHLRQSAPEGFSYQKAGERTWEKMGIFASRSV
jgi:hypothetical protein